MRDVQNKLADIAAIYTRRTEVVVFQVLERCLGILEKLCMLRLLSILLLMCIIVALGEVYKTSVRRWSLFLASYVLVEKS